MADSLDHEANERQIAERTRAENREELELTDAVFNLMTDGFNLLPRPFNADDERRVLIVQLVTLGYNSLRQAQHCLLHGYYSQAIALARTAWEAWLHGAYLRLYEDVPLEAWVRFDTRPRPSVMRRRVASRSHPENPDSERRFLEDLDKLYSGYSDYSHPGERAVGVLLDRNEDGSLTLRLGGAFSTGLLCASVNLFCTSGYLLSTLLTWEIADGGHPYQAYFDRGRALVAQINEWRRQFAPTPEEAKELEPPALPSR